MDALQPSRFPYSRKGFTLIELSIVLVVIGLLIGGILAAQSMIDSARGTKLIRTVEQYMVAGRNFKTTYGYWPGDYPNAAFGCPGDGNGIVAYGASGSGNCSTDQYEGTNFFVQLSMAGFITDKLTYYTGAGAIQPGVNVPVGPDKNSHFVIKQPGLWQTPTGPYAFGWGSGQVPNEVGLSTSFMLYGAFTNTSDNRGSPDVLIPPGIALHVDTKIDDGMPNTGDILETSHGSCTTNGDYTADVGYAPQNSTSKCIMGFKLTDSTR